MRVAVALVWVLLGACAAGREEIIETNVPLYMAAGAPEAAPSASASGTAALPGDDRDR